MYKVKRFSKYPSTKERLRSALNAALVGGGVGTILGIVAGAGIGLLSSIANPHESFKHAVKSILKGTAKGAGIGALISGGLGAVGSAWSVWKNTSKKYIQESEKRDKEIKDRNKRLKSSIKSWSDIKKVYGYDVPKDYIKFLDILPKTYGCPLFTYIEEPWLLAADIEYAIECKDDPNSYSVSPWECVALVGDGVGDNLSTNVYYDFDKKAWYNYDDIKFNNLKEFIAYVYDNHVYEQDFSDPEDYDAAMESRDLIIRSL